MERWSAHGYKQRRYSTHSTQHRTEHSTAKPNGNHGPRHMLRCKAARATGAYARRARSPSGARARRTLHAQRIEKTLAAKVEAARRWTTRVLAGPFGSFWGAWSIAVLRELFWHWW